MTKEEYEVNLDDNLKKLVARMKNGSYRPNPTRRVYIPKDGSRKMRPLGISCYEDKLVENAVAQILTMVYELKFYPCSFGFRPGRNCHMAVREIIEMVQYRKTNYVVEADIRSYFDTIPHDWLMKMLEHDLADRRFLEIIRRFLKAGVMENCNTWTVKAAVRRETVQVPYLQTCTCTMFSTTGLMSLYRDSAVGSATSSDMLTISSAASRINGKRRYSDGNWKRGLQSTG